MFSENSRIIVLLATPINSVDLLDLIPSSRAIPREKNNNQTTYVYKSQIKTPVA